MKAMHKLLTAAALVLPLSLAQAADLKIGFVSVAKILSSAPQAEAASKRLEQEFAPRQKGLSKRRNRYASLRKSCPRMGR